MFSHPLKKIVQDQKKGIACGIYSACTANEMVIEAVMRRALMCDQQVLIEATANQVNQQGGYTGMLPSDFRNLVSVIADKVKFPFNRIILGGDHLGPLTWRNEPASSAMEKASILVRDYVRAGFSKIHIDTSMHLGDDDKNHKLDTAVIAERGGILCKIAEETFSEIKAHNSATLRPVYVIGSEVPIPGGSQDEEESLKVTCEQDFNNTVETFYSVFKKMNLDDALENIIAVVVQPGVEFGDDTIHEYNRDAAKTLVNALLKYPGIVFEGHSTDYQTADSLRQMVEDGIAILKVGPALTFALREALFSLNMMENEMFRFSPDIQLSNFILKLDDLMAKSPSYWENHYHGAPSKVRFSRKYSLSDRCRYYLPLPEIRESLNLMIHNLKSGNIPLSLISEFMPVQYAKIRYGLISNHPDDLISDRIINYIDDYCYAVTPESRIDRFGFAI